MEMDELMSFLDSTPVDGILPSQLYEYDELAKELEDALQGGGEEDGNDNPPRCATPPPPRPASWPAMAPPPPPHPPILTFPKDPFETNEEEDEGEDDFASMLRGHVFAPSVVAEEVDVTSSRRGATVCF
jgi:hypothetical protein